MKNILIEHNLFQEFNAADVPGASAAIFKDGRFLFSLNCGLANLETKTPASERTNYRIASVSKQFTAMAIMILRHRGAIDYDTPISSFFTDFPTIGENITVRRLMNHTSGIVNYEDIIPPEVQKPLKDADVLELIKHQHGVYFTPGTQYKYSNTGYALLALIVEHVSGARFADFMRENIFAPLGMLDTVLHEDGITEVKNRAIGYKKTDKGFEWADQSLTSAVLGDGGIYTSLEDYLKWDQALYGETLVPRPILDEAWMSGTLTDGAPINYGFGWRVEERNGVRLIHHNGSTCGFNSAVRRMPDKKMTLVIFTNRNGNQSHQIADNLTDYILDNNS